MLHFRGEETCRICYRKRFCQFYLTLVEFIYTSLAYRTIDCRVGSVTTILDRERKPRNIITQSKNKLVEFFLRVLHYLRHNFFLGRCCTVLNEVAKRMQHVGCSIWTQGFATKIYYLGNKPAPFFFLVEPENRAIPPYQTIFLLSLVLQCQLLLGHFSLYLKRDRLFLSFLLREIETFVHSSYSRGNARGKYKQ